METATRSSKIFKRMKRTFKHRIFNIILLHAGIAAFALFYMAYIGCPTKRLFGISCPGCGMARAHIAILHGDIRGALAAHPLFWLAIPLIFLFLHSEIFNFHISKKTLTIIGLASIILLFVVYLLRVFVLHDPVVQPDFEHSIFYRFLKFIKLMSTEQL